MANSNNKAAEEAVAKKVSKPMYVKFLKSPTGKYGMSYHVGDIASIDGDEAVEMIDSKWAVKATAAEIKESKEKQ